jgi:Tfp pilus assembly protein PilF
MRTVAAAALVLAFSSTALADVSESLLSRSHAAERAGNKDAAERLAQSAIVADPKRASSYVGLADIYMHAGQPDFAGFYYAEALQIDPQNKDAVKGLATADRASKEETAAAERSLDKQKSGH